MDFLKLIQSLQELIYELVIWALLLPKTLLRVVFRPDRMVKYVNAEWKKGSEEQFDEYLAPTAFFILVAVLPAAVIAAMDGTSVPFAPAVTEADLFYSVLVMLIVMLIYLAWIEWLNKRPLKRSGLKRLFYIQCYLLSAAQLVYILLLFALNLLGVFTIALLGMAILIFYESFALQDELNVGWRKGLWYAALPYLVFFLLSFVALAAMILFFDVNPADIMEG